MYNHSGGIDNPAQPGTVHIQNPLGSRSRHTIESKVGSIDDPPFQHHASQMIDLKTHGVLDDQLRNFAEENLHQGVLQDRIHLGDMAKKLLVGGFHRHNQ